MYCREDLILTTLCVWWINVNLVSGNEDGLRIILGETSNGLIKQELEKCDKGEGHIRLDVTEKDKLTSLTSIPKPKYLDNFNNPCWIECLPKDKSDLYDKDDFFFKDAKFNDHFQFLLEDAMSRPEQTWRLRCLPKFYLIGFPKCGTSDLFTRIMLHPDVASMGTKEVRFWSIRSQYPNKVYDFERYLDIADIGAHEVLKNVRINDTTFKVSHPIIFGEGTPSTIFSGLHWKREVDENILEKGENLTEFMLTPKYFSYVQPQAKFIVALREPASMVYSAYKFFGRIHRQSSLGPEEFNYCVVNSLDAYFRCEENHTANYCAHIDPARLEFKGKINVCYFVMRGLQLGRYYVFLSEWMKYYPKEQFFIVRSEDYQGNEKQTLINLWEYLGLRRLEKYLPNTYNRLKEINKTKVSIAKMFFRTEMLLQEFFRPSNERLAKLLGHNRYLWEKT